jgi:Protein of unknown function (DUF1488)
MNLLDSRPCLSKDGRAVVFSLSIRGNTVECAVARDALEEYFWLQRGADEARVLKTFENGWKRIVAIAERKTLARTDGRLSICLKADDFITR